MITVNAISGLSQIQGPSVLTIGTFDGVHVGHQTLFGQLKNLPGMSCCLTFSNHPSEVLRPQSPTPLLTSSAHKCHLLEQLGLDATALIPFTSELASLTAEDFLAHVHRHLPFTKLLLGHDAHLGRGRGGTPEVITKVGRQLGFDVTYMPVVAIEGHPVSSSRIRHAVQAGHLHEAEKLLGRKLSYRTEVQRGPGVGRRIGFRTANLHVAGLCLPPQGIYAVTLCVDGHTLPGVANLGVAPTVQERKEPVLEVHLFDHAEELYGQAVEAVLHKFLRSEQRFDSIEQLKRQIALDIEMARAYFSD